MRQENKIAVVTGGSQGIGFGIARKLAKEGAKVIIGSRKKPIKSLPNDITHYNLDVTKEYSIAEFFDIIKNLYGKIDILVNNAGVMYQEHFLKASIEKWDLTMNVNLRGVFICCRYAVDLMLKSSSGSIVNIGSIEGEASNPNHTAYTASKSGILGLTRAMAVDLGDFNIRCNTVCPGWVQTALNEEYFKDVKNKEQVEKAMNNLHPSGRLGTPEDVAKLVSWLSSTEAAWITGQDFTVDGGRLAKISNINSENLR